jgi:chromosome segregation ATPase
MRLQLGVALTLSIAAGSVAGVILGGKTGVKPGLEAGSRFDAAMLAPGESATAQVAAQSDPTPEMARMLDEVRGLRAQIEQFRHGVETARTADRARAQETARDASLEAREQALDQTTASLAAKLSEIDSRLARLERSGADATPVGSIAKPARAGHAVKARAREVR